jgi:predicted RNA polymerase sigma factor
LTAYHVEAAIAAAHASAATVDETDWGLIVSLYDRLMTIAPSPVVALNHAIAIGQLEGADRGLEALQTIDDRERLNRYPFLPAAKGELELRRGTTTPPGSISRLPLGWRETRPSGVFWKGACVLHA